MEELFEMLIDISLRRIENEDDDISWETICILREVECIVCHVETIPKNVHELASELLNLTKSRIKKEQEHGLTRETSELLRLIRGNIGAFL